jgi:hypothetical protein
VDLNGLGISEDTLKICGAAAMACVVKVIASKTFSLTSIIRRLVVTVCVALYAAEIVKYFEVSGSLATAITIGVAFFADDLVVVAFDIGQEFRRNPTSLFNFIKRLLDRK